MEINQLTGTIIGAAIEVHRELGPGLLESTYEACLHYELDRMGVRCQRQLALPVIYKGQQLDCGYRVDLLVAACVPVEIKTVDKVLPVHEAQLLTYLRLGGWHAGLLLNFHVPRLRDGVTRLVNRLPE